MKSLIKVLALVAILALPRMAFAASAPTCESLGYVQKESDCKAKKLTVLKCPFDETNTNKVYCGLVKTCESLGLSSKEASGDLCSPVTKEGLSCYKCTNCSREYDSLNMEYKYIIKNASNCGKYVSYNSVMHVRNETCEEFQFRLASEVNEYNNSLCGRNYKKITSSPSQISCNTCCVGKGHEIGVLSMCVDNDVEVGGFISDR